MPSVPRSPAIGALRSRHPARIGLSLLAAIALVTAVLPLSGTTTPALAAARGLHVSTLRVNTFVNPVGVGLSGVVTNPAGLVPAPLILSWQVSGVAGNGPASQQSAFEIRVATSVPKLDTPDLWDSGQVSSSVSNNVPYAGTALTSREAVVWDVRVWDGNGSVSAWSAPATWEMGLLSNSDWSGQWIEDPDYTYATAGVPNPLPIFGKAFGLTGAVAKARLYLTGLGQYSATLNGQPISTAVLEPGETTYHAEVDYRTYDVTSLLQAGSNVLGVETGSGEYDRVTSTGRYFFQNNPEPVYGTPKVIAQLEVTYSDGSVQTIATDSSWLTELGPTTYSAWWAGEDYDARRIAPNWTSSAANLTGPGWRNAGLVTLTSSTYPENTTPLIADPRPPVIVQREVQPVAINRVTLAGGNTTLVAPSNAGDSNVKLASVSSFAVGDTINVDTGGTPETATITAVGTAAGTARQLTAPAAAGDTNVSVSSVSGFTAGQQILIDTGTALESATISTIGTAAGTAGTTLAATAVGDTNIKVSSVSGYVVGQQLVIDTGANAEKATVSAVGTAGVSPTIPGVSTTLAVTSTTLTGPTAAGISTVAVANNAGFTPGLSVGIDTGAAAETATVASVASSGLPVPVYTVTPNAPVANWIWNIAGGASDAPSPAYMRKDFTIADPSLVTSAPLRVNGDDSAFVYVNGNSLGQTSTVTNGWQNSTLVDIKPYLVAGNNVVAIQGLNVGGGSAGSGSVIGALEIYGSGGLTSRYVTDTSWKALAGTPATGPTGWTTASFDDSAWGNAFISGAYGVFPWNSSVQTIPSTTTYSITFNTPLANAHAANAILGAITPAGVTNIKVASVTGFSAGQSITIDTGASLETVTIGTVGTAGAAGTGLTLVAPTTLAHNGAVSIAAVVAPIGATNVKVSSVTRLTVGDTVYIDTGANVEAVVLTAVGTAGATGTGITFTPALTILHAPGTVVVDRGTGITVSALTLPHAFGVAIRGAGSGITFTPALTAPHAVGVTARGAGTGITFTPALTAAHAFGATVTGTKPPAYVLDFGVNESGLPKITISGPAGTKISMIPAETVNANGTVNVSSTGASATSQILYNYTLSGVGTETWHSQFTYNGFRYLQVSGLTSPPTPSTITTLVTYASNAPTASFSTSSSLLNSIYAITQRALESNMESVFTDCPDREKGPYTGDNLHNIDTILTLYDVQAFEGQMVANMTTAQRPVPFNSASAGMIANIAPEYHFVPPSVWLDEPNWGGAVIMIPWNLYQVYGDTKVMTANYSTMVKWLNWEATTKAAHGGNIVGLGDWSAAQSTTAQAIIDYGYYRGANTMAKIAQLLGNAADAATYSALATSLATEYNTKYLHTDASGNAWYANNTEASNAAALDAGLVPAQYHQAVVNSLVAAVVAYGYRIGTGSVAIGPLFRQLHAAGRDDIIYQMVVNPASPGYAYLVNSGHTTLSEALDGSGSQNHQFLGEVDSWFVHGLAGIQQATDSIGYKSLLIKPAVVGDLASASGSYTTPAGDVTSAWTHVGKGISLNVSVPDNVTATVSLPTTSTTQSYRASGNGGAVFVGIQDGREIWTVGAGQTHFQPK